MRKHLHAWMAACALLTSTFIHAQSDSTFTQDKFQFKLGAFYNSNLNYYGRTDSLRSSGFFPIAEVWLNNKFYITGIPIFVANSTTSFAYAGSVATAGLRFGKESKYSVNIYIVKPFYKDNSQLPQSALKAQAAGTYTWLNKIVNVTMGGDVKFSNNIDYGATAGLDHIFRFQLPGQCVLVIDPSAYINAGSQQFSKTSYDQNNFPILGSSQETKEDVRAFNILSYEFSVPVVFAKGNWQFIALPAYVLPQNLLHEERGQSTFYTTAGIKLNL